MCTNARSAHVVDRWTCLIREVERMYEIAPIVLMLSHVVLYYCNDRLVVVFRLPIRLGVIGPSGQLFHRQIAANGSEELRHEFRSVICLDVAAYTVRYDPIFQEDVGHT